MKPLYPSKIAISLTCFCVLLSSCSSNVPFVAQYRPILKELDSGITQYDVSVELNSRLPFGEVDPSHFSSGWDILGTNFGLVGAVIAQAHKNNVNNAAQATVNNVLTAKAYQLADDLDASIKTTFLKSPTKASSVTTFISKEPKSFAAKGDASLEIFVKQSFSPEFQRYNFRADLKMLPNTKNLRDKNAATYANEAGYLYKNSITYSAIVDNVKTTDKASYENAWKADDGRLAQLVMRQAVRVLAEIAKRDVDAIADKPIGNLATLETINLVIDGRPIKAERLGSGSWNINSYTSDLAK